MSEDRLMELPAILSNISPERIQTMLRQGHFYWEKYFKSMRDITLTTLQIINDRVFPYNGKSYEYWNEVMPRVSATPRILFRRVSSINIFKTKNF